MKGGKGKAPTIQWYYRDWSSDTKLQLSSPSTRGIWMNILMYMIDCTTDGTNCKPGVLTDLTVDHICRLGACSVDEAEQFIEEALLHRFCDIAVTDHGAVTLMSRRIGRDDKKRREWRKRQKEKRLRDKQAQQDKPTNSDSHAGVTPDSHPSSTSTATATPNGVIKDMSGKGLPSYTSQLIERTIEYLNRVTGKKFQHTSQSSQKFLRGRISQGYRFRDFKHVVDVKTAEWLNDPENDRFLRPETLFNETKFQAYVNQKGTHKWWKDLNTDHKQ